MQNVYRYNLSVQYTMYIMRFFPRILEGTLSANRNKVRYFLSLIVCEVIITMTEILTLEKIIAFLKTDLTFACCWPLPMKATKFQKIRDKIFRLFCCLNGIVMSISLIYTLSNKCDNMILIMKVGCELSAFLQVPIQIILFTLQSDRLQVRDTQCAFILNLSKFQLIICLIFLTFNFNLYIYIFIFIHII